MDSGDGEILDNSEQMGPMHGDDLNHGYIVWNRVPINIPGGELYCLVYWDRKVYWIDGGGGVHCYNLGNGQNMHYYILPIFVFNNDGHGQGPRVFLTTRDTGVLYVSATDQSVWIGELVDGGNENGLVRPLQQAVNIEGGSIFVNRGQGGIFVENLSSLENLEDTISVGPHPHDCSTFHLETQGWQLQKGCDFDTCSGLWLLSEYERLVRNYLYYSDVWDLMPVAIEWASGGEEEEDDEEQDDSSVVSDEEAIKRKRFKQEGINLKASKLRMATGAELRGTLPFSHELSLMVAHSHMVMEAELRESIPLNAEVSTMDESRLETTQNLLSCEASLGEAATTPPPIDLTPEAIRALQEDGSLVQVYSGSQIFQFHGSKALGGDSAICHPVGSDDIFSCIDPDIHMLILQQGQRTMSFGRPTENVVRIIKAVIARYVRTGGKFGRGRSVRQKTNRTRKQKLRAKEGGSSAKPNEKLPDAINRTEPVFKTNNSGLIVIKKVSRNKKSRHNSFRPLAEPSIEVLMKLAREKEEGCALGVIFGEWKLNAFSLPVLPLVPSLNNCLPWVYMADPGRRLGDHVFGNMTLRQSFSVANSDLQSSSALLYSADGWLLLQGRDMDLSSSWRLPRYPVFLLNPTTGARMDLPSFFFLGGYAAFRMTAQGTLGVVIYVRSWGCNVSVFMVRPGCASWEEHAYVFKHGLCDKMKKIILCGDVVYCFFTQVILIFKLADLSWHLIRGERPQPKVAYHEPLEVEGKVVMVGHPEHVIRGSFGWESIPFLRMEIRGDEFEWVKIDVDDELLNGAHLVSP